MDDAPPSSKPPKKVVNPYTSSFIGGAENARRKAQRRRRGPPTRVPIPGEQERRNTVLPNTMNPLDRFFAALLLSPVKDYLRRSNDAENSLWLTVCGRLGITPPTAPLLGINRDVRDHCNKRIALMLEESRCAVANSLQSDQKKKPTMVLSVHSVEQVKNGFTRMILKSSRPFLKEELYDLRTASVVKIRSRGSPDSIEQLHLGAITSSNKQMLEQTHSFTVTVYTRLPFCRDDSEWLVTVLGTLITELRCVEVLSSPQVQRLPIVTAIQGMQASYTKFSDFLSDDDSVVVLPNPNDLKVTPKDNSISNEKHKSKRRELNDSQRTVCEDFLDSNPEHSKLVHCVQGPPGTGKTALLVQLISDYLEQYPDRRILVCAPTNKAIGVLASRFLLSNPDMDQVVMVGDGYKLLSDESSKGGVQPMLSSIFVFTFVQAVTEDFRRIKGHFGASSSRNRMSPSQLYGLAKRWEQRINAGLPGLPVQILQLLKNISMSLEKLANGGGCHDITPSLDKILSFLKDLPADQVFRDLLQSARVIFCTLATSGSMLVRTTEPVDDVIVDEAAAATEPETMIPLWLKPKRMLFVGDPRQLPATLVSRRAVDLGLSKSLQERLMYDCGYKYTMLDMQYRMHPEICSWISKKFYSNRLQNGPNVTKVDYANRLLVKGMPYCFLDVEGVEEQARGGSCCNIQEARSVAMLLQTIRNRTSSEDWQNVEKIRVITFYQAQVGLIKRILRESGGMDKITVATVDSSQGCESDTVIVSLVRTGHTANPGFLTDNRRLNVALTRARFQLLCVGNLTGLQSYKTEAASTLHELTSDAVERNVVSTSIPDEKPEDTGSLLDLFYGQPSVKKARLL